MAIKTVYLDAPEVSPEKVSLVEGMLNKTRMSGVLAVRSFASLKLPEKKGFIVILMPVMDQNYPDITKDYLSTLVFKVDTDDVESAIDQILTDYQKAYSTQGAALENHLIMEFQKEKGRSPEDIDELEEFAWGDEDERHAMFFNFTRLSLKGIDTVFPVSKYDDYLKLSVENVPTLSRGVWLENFEWLIIK